jgi:hypothetical protein
VTFGGASRSVKVAIAGVVLATAAVAGSALAATATTTTTTDPAPAGGTGPTIAVVDQKFPDDAVARGSTFKVQGKGWAPNSLVELEVCGNHADSGSSDCAVGTAVVVASDDLGAFAGRVSLVLPPAPCPCVVRAISQNSNGAATADVTIPGAPIAHAGDGKVTAPALRRLDVEHVKLVGSDTIGTWLGGRATRRLEFEIVNSGTVPVTGASVDFVAGPKGNPTGFIPPVKLDRLEVGQRRKLVVPIRFDALAFGDQAVRGSVLGTSAPTSFTTFTSTHPWLLVVVPLLVVGQLALLGVRNVLRRRLHARLVDPEAGLLDANTPADDALICVVEMVEPDPDADPEGEQPRLRHQTLVLRSIAAVQQLVLDTLTVPHANEPDPEQPGAVAVLHRPVDSRLINTITILADVDLTVGEAYHACDALCAWVESTFAESDHPAARSLTLRRHVGSSGSSAPAPGAQLGMVPLGVLVRTSPVRATPLRHNVNRHNEKWRPEGRHFTSEPPERGGSS